MTILDHAVRMSELGTRCREAVALDPTRHLLTELPDVTPQSTDLQSFPVTVAFVGQYSSGKTTLINALTGADLPTGAGIVTDRVQEIPWHGVLLVDTPGVQSGTREDHDERARLAYLSSDLLVFVTTSAMLDPAGHQLLHHLAGESGKAQQMVFVVNKVSQDPATPTALRQAARDAVAPHDLDIVLCDALDHLEAAGTEDPELQEELRADSGIDELAQVLTDLARRNGTFGRLATPIQRARPVLERADGALAARIKGLELDASDLELVLEPLGRACELLDSGATRILTDVERQITELADKPCDLILHSSEDDEAKDDGANRLASLVAEADEKIEQIYNGQATQATELITEINRDLESKYVQIATDPAALGGQPRLGVREPDERLRRLLSDVAHGVLGHPGGSGTADGTVRVRLPTGVRPGEPLHSLVHAVKRQLQGSDVRPWSVVNAAKKIEGLAELLNKFLDTAGPAVKEGLKNAANLGLQVVLEKFDESMKRRQATELRSAYEHAAGVAREELARVFAGFRNELENQASEVEQQVAARRREAATLDGQRVQITGLAAELDTFLAELEQFSESTRST